VNAVQKSGSIELTTFDAKGKSNMKMVVNFTPFSITVFEFDGDEEFQV